ncbi:hypothetical protein EB008_02860 [bacterium]|jgi:hypothetical protein|nr:hypothetical protein [bacterium]
MKKFFLLLVTATLFGDICIDSTLFRLPQWEQALKEITHPNFFAEGVTFRSFRDPQSLTIVYLAATNGTISPQELAAYPLFSKKHTLEEEILTEKGCILFFKKDPQKCSCNCCNPNPITVRIDYLPQRTALAVVLHRLEQKEAVRNILGYLEIENHLS